LSEARNLYYVYLYCFYYLNKIGVKVTEPVN
jgi:hypothetical protein